MVKKIVGSGPKFEHLFWGCGGLIQKNPPKTQRLSNETRAPGCLGLIGDEILPSYMGIIRNHYKDPY